MPARLAADLAARLAADLAADLAAERPVIPAQRPIREIFRILADDN